MLNPEPDAQEDLIEGQLANGGGQPEEAATIDHQEVHVNLSPSKPPHPVTGVVTTQPGMDSNVQYTSSTDKIVMDGENTPTVIVQGLPDPKRKPKDFVVTSCIVILLCNFVFGLLGWHFGLKSNWAWQLGDEAQARKRAKMALLFVILGIVTGVITWVLAFTLFFVLRDVTITKPVSQTEGMFKPS